MPLKKMDFDTVREVALALPGVEQSRLHGAPTVKLCGRLLACPALHKSAEANSLVVRVGVEQRAVLLAHDPNVFYVTDHYISYPSILARLDRIDPKALRKLLEMAGDLLLPERRSGDTTARDLSHEFAYQSLEPTPKAFARHGGETEQARWPLC